VGREAERGADVQVVVRSRPRQTIYVRKPPVTMWRPTPAQAELRYLFAESVRVAKELSVEDVARLVRGEVVDVGGKKAIRMPDGRILMKHMAYVKYALSGYRSPESGVKVPAWLEDIAWKWFKPAPLKKVGEVVKSK